MNTNKIILGLDPGSLVTGFGLIKICEGQISHVVHGVIKLNSKKSISARLQDLAFDLSLITKKYEPHIAIVENVFAYKNLRSALILGQARGAILAILGLNNVPVFELSPTRIKSVISGQGRAKKFQVAKIVATELEIDVPKEEDASDALACALAYGLLRVYPC